MVKDLVDLKMAPLHPLLRRSAALAYTMRWWGILLVDAQTAAIDCILGQDSPVTLQGQDPPLATVFQWADLGHISLTTHMNTNMIPVWPSRLR